MSQILRIVLPTPLPQLYDYRSLDDQPIKPQVGMRARVSFHYAELVGIIWEIVATTDIPETKLKTIIAYLDETPIIDPKLHQLLTWAHQYYHHPLGEVVATALPAALRKGNPAILDSHQQFPSVSEMQPETKLTLNSEQALALEAIIAELHQFKVFLLQGVTGSGKTEVYLQAIEQVLHTDSQALILVPEIGLTPQMIARFQARFSEPVCVFHSRMTEKQRLLTWLWAKSGKAKLIIGTRSAVFIPLLKLGIIIVDESHDISFKQQDGWRYSARDVAIKRANIEQVPIVLGSATPCLESLANAEKARFTTLYLKVRAADAQTPRYCVLDIRNQSLQYGLAPRLIEMLRSHLACGHQVLLFLNRRGFAPSLVCHHCGWSIKCQFCDVNLTLHLTPRYLQCHHCGVTARVPETCGACHTPELTPIGLGTERLEQGLQQLFADYSIVRIDRDGTKRKGELTAKLAKIQSGEYQILLGTQMLAKGHHFPNVTLVAILEIDSGLYSAEFRACERLAQLIEQVAGRAGRATKLGEVVLQTRCPTHPLFHILLSQGYAEYAKILLQERVQAHLPPYVYLALYRAEAPELKTANTFLEYIRKVLTPTPAGLYCFGPVTAPLVKKANRYRAQLLLQADQRSILHQALDRLTILLSRYPKTKGLRWSLDVDPAELF